MNEKPKGWEPKIVNEDGEEVEPRKWKEKKAAEQHKEARPEMYDRDLNSVTPNQLIDKWSEIKEELPVDVLDSVGRERINELRMRFKETDYRVLYDYLSRDDIWQRPAYTLAVLEEVEDRIKRKEY